MKATVQFTILHASAAKTSVLFSFNRAGDGRRADRPIPDDKVVLTKRAAAGATIWEGAFALEPDEVETVSYSFSFQAPVGSSYRYTIEVDGDVVAAQRDTRVKKEFDAIVGDLS